MTVEGPHFASLASLAAYRAGRLRARLFGATRIEDGRVVTQGSIVILLCNAEVMLVRQRFSRDVWGFPGGLMRRSESPAGAAKRELYEETGLSVPISNDDLLTSYLQPWTNHRDHVFVVELERKLDSGGMKSYLEIGEARWHSKEAVQNLNKRLETEYLLEHSRDVLSQQPEHLRRVGARYLRSRLDIWSKLSPVLAGVSALLAALGILLLPQTELELRDKRLVHVACLAALALAMSLAYAFRSRAQRSAHVKTPRMKALDLEDSNEVVARALERTLELTEEYVLWIYEITCEPRQRIWRISESVEAYTRSMSIATTVTLAPGELPPENAPLALLSVPKREMIDGLKIFDGSGERLSTLPQNVIHNEALASILFLVARAFRDPDRASELIDVSFMTECAMTIRGEGDSDFFPSLEIAHQIWRQCGFINAEGSKYFWLARRLLGACSKDLYIAVSSGKGARFRVERREMPQYLRAIRKRDRPVLEGIRHFFGIRPTLLSIPLGLVGNCRSYHLQVKGPEGTYLGQQFIRPVWGKGELDASALSIYFRTRLGQRHAHLYAREVPSLSGFYSVNFFERTPGSIGVASVVALAAASMICLSGAVKLGYGNSSESDLIAVMLAFPAVVGAWTGLDRDQIRGSGTLAARVTSIGSSILSLISAIAYILLPKNELEVALIDRTGFGLWGGLGISSIMIAFAATGTWILRTSLYRRFLTRAKEGLE